MVFKIHEPELNRLPGEMPMGRSDEGRSPAKGSLRPASAEERRTRGEERCWPQIGAPGYFTSSGDLLTRRLREAPQERHVCS
jgi:hypothetical protein